MYCGTSAAGSPEFIAGSSPADWVCAPVGSRASESNISISSLLPSPGSAAARINSLTSVTLVPFGPS